MATLNPDHLLDQAAELTAAPAAGPPRQVDVRRAISAAYYAVFHALLTAAADEVVGKTKRGSTDHSLAYRSINHRWLRDMCVEAAKTQPGKKLSALVPVGGFGPNLQKLAEAVVELQQRRHEADYNPGIRVKTADALFAISTARSAIRRLAKAPAAKRKRFLLCLLFPPRGRSDEL